MIEFSDLKYSTPEELYELLETIANTLNGRMNHENWNYMRTAINMEPINYETKGDTMPNKTRIYLSIDTDLFNHIEKARTAIGASDRSAYLNRQLRNHFHLDEEG